MLNTKDDYFTVSRQQGLPTRCPLLDRCERRAHTVAIANDWDFDEAPKHLDMKAPLVESVGEPAYLLGGSNNFTIGGQCPEVGLFESTMAIIGLSGRPLTKGRYDKYMDPQYKVLETGHFSECAEYVRSCHEDSAPTATKPTGAPLEFAPAEKVTLRWLFNHVPLFYWGAAATLLGTIFYAGLQASQIEIVRELFHIQPTRQAGATPAAKLPAVAVPRTDAVQ
jgi:hypothetical protein